MNQQREGAENYRKAEESRQRLLAIREKRGEIRAQRNDFADAHADGLHDGLPREGCPECFRR